MSKKFGKFLLFSAVAGAAAYGAYHYFQTKDNAPSSDKDEDTDDDFDDFSEDLDEDTDVTKERSYVSLNLDKAEAIASEAFHKAKEVIADSVQQVKDTVKSVTESQSVSETNFTDLTAVNKEKNAENETDDTTADDNASADPKVETASQEVPAKDETPLAKSSAENASSEGASIESSQKVEEFYNDSV